MKNWGLSLLLFFLLLGSFKIRGQNVTPNTTRPEQISEDVWQHILEDRATTPKEKERRFLTNRLMMRDVGITLLAALGLVVFIFFNAKNSRQRNQRKLRLYKQRSTQAEMRSIELKSELIKSELGAKEQQMTKLLTLIKQKNHQLDHLKSALSEKQKIEKADVLGSVSELFNSEKEWENFRLSFEQIHNGFFDKLLSNFPSLTPHELRLCALLRLNLSSKEIASVLNISPSSVNTGRYRMRKKMQLTESDDLIRYLMAM